MSEGSKFFEGRGAVQAALYKIAQRLADLHIPYAVAGGMALFRHGHRRFTEDVDILVTRQGLRAIHEQPEVLGYIPPFPRSKHLRDTELGVKIEFLVSGDYPGDGRPKPIAFPEPESVAVELEGVKYLSLESLIELKLASGMSSADREKDLVDVQALISAHGLPLGFADKLHPYVREKYREQWQKLRQPSKRYLLLWRNKWLTSEAGSLDDMIASLRAATAQLEAMKADGVGLHPGAGTTDDYAYLVTTDPEIARKYEMHPEDEYWDEGEPGGVKES